MIDPTSGVGSASSQTSATSATKKDAVAESQDRFLKLLVTQMKNQDPLNPMDNAQVTSQMAQLSTVSGIDKLNATLQALSSSMIASQSMQAASMIGHVGRVPGNQMDLVNGKGMAALNLDKPADSVSVEISDAAGNVVRHMQLGSQSSGVVPMQWDGLNDTGLLVADGSYKFSATAQLGGVKSSVSTMSYGLVNSVMQGPQGATLNVGQLGEVSLASVRQIL
jgi:flagellar basal-body rod modification protein FlgD